MLKVAGLVGSALIAYQFFRASIVFMGAATARIFTPEMEGELIGALVVPVLSVVLVILLRFGFKWKWPSSILCGAIGSPVIVLIWSIAAIAVLIKK